MNPRTEALLWSAAREGGVVAALLGPVLVLVFGVLWPAGLLPARVLSPDHLTALAAGWLLRIVLLAAFALIAVHAAHRVRFLVRDLGLSAGRRVAAGLCYGAAAAMTAWAGWLLF